MAYATITITAPSSAEQGERVSVSVNIKNASLYGATFRAEISAVSLIGTIEKFLGPKESVTRSASFTMPGSNTTISVWVQSWEFDYVTHAYAWLYAGSASKVVSLEVVPTTFHLSVFVPSWAAGGYIDPGSGNYPAYSTVKLTAYPLTGYQFTSWGGDASGTSPTYNLYMNSDKNVEAYFEKIPVTTYHLDVFVPSWAAGGSISPGSGDYSVNTTVKLTATPFSGYQFVSWGGDASGTALTFNLYMDSDKYVEAYFEKIPVPETFHLSVYVPPWAAGGYVEPGSGDYPANETVTLTAHPLDGYQFVSWGGDASGTALTYNLYMNSDKNVEAYFEKIPVPAGSIISKELKYDGVTEAIPVY